MDNIKLVIREKYNQMSKGERCISDLVLSNVIDYLSMTTVDITKKSGASSASAIWYVQKLRYGGPKGFELVLTAANSQDSERKMAGPIISTDDGLDRLVDKFGILIGGAMKDLFYQLDKDTPQEAIDVIKYARRICPMGIGASMLPACDLFRKLKRADFNASYYFDVNVQMEFFNYIDERGVIIAFSYNGQPQEILHPCRIAKEMKSKVVVVTRDRESALQQIADICPTIPDKEAVMGTGAFTSPHMSVMTEDLLYLSVIQEDLEQIGVELIKTKKLVERLKIGFQEGSIYGKY